MLGKTEAQLDELTGTTQQVIQLDKTLVAAYAAGQISWDTLRGTALIDTAYTGVRNSVGMELYVPFFNDTTLEITDGQVINALGVDATNKVVKGVLGDASSPATSSAIIGLATHTVPDQTVGLATIFGDVNDIDTTNGDEGGPLYVSETAGEFTSTRPRYPSNIVILGTIVSKHVSAGVAFLNVSPFSRQKIVKDYHISTGSIATREIAGFYDWEGASVTLDQGSLTQTLGAVLQTRAAHVGIVPEAAGTVDTGQVGLRVVGTMDDETGPQLALQTAIITDDITTLNADAITRMAETTEKFSGQVTLELYVVSGTPVNYDLTFNYGFSKYEDYANTNFTLGAFEALWEGSATDTDMDLIVRHHTALGWEYAATGFLAGNGVICQRSVDQAIAGGVASGVEGSYKRIALNQYIAGATSEGLLIQLVTGTINSIANMDIHMLAYNEDLS